MPCKLTRLGIVHLPLFIGPRRLLLQWWTPRDLFRHLCSHWAVHRWLILEFGGWGWKLFFPHSFDGIVPYPSRPSFGDFFPLKFYANDPIYRMFIYALFQALGDPFSVKSCLIHLWENSATLYFHIGTPLTGMIGFPARAPKYHMYCQKRVCLLLYILFLNYISLIMLLQWPQFFSLCPPPPSTPSSFRQSPHHCSCPWVMGISSLATSLPILYFTSPWLFCNYLFVLLNPFTSLPIPTRYPPIWEPSKHSPYPWFYLCSSYLFTLFFRFSCWLICIYCHFIVHSFYLLFLK